MDKHDLKKWRKSQDMTQAKFAQYLGVVERTVQNWEAGSTDVPTSLAVVHADGVRLYDALAELCKELEDVHDVGDYAYEALMNARLK